MESRLEKIFSMGINIMSLAVWLGEDRKCSAAVVGLDLLLGLSVVRRCSLNPRRIGSSSHNALRLNYIIVVFDYVTIHLLWISLKSCRKPRRHSAKESLFISIASISEHRKVFSSINFLVFK